jgi:hypothetical protein
MGVWIANGKKKKVNAILKGKQIMMGGAKKGNAPLMSKILLWSEWNVLELERSDRSNTL